MISILNMLWSMHMKIAIIDDDQNDREYLTTYIKNYGQNHPFPFSIDTFSSGELFFKNSIYTEYSIIFVDIYMEGIDGVEIAHTIHSSNKDCLIIFFTSSQDDMWRAIKTHACFDYLLKTSVTEQNINDVLDSALKRLHKYDGTLDFIVGKKHFSLNF